MSIFRHFRAFLHARDGATAIEYGLLATLVSVSLIVGVEAAGDSISNLFVTVDNQISSAGK